MLYLGLNPPKNNSDQIVIHYPVIKIQPKSPVDDYIEKIMIKLASYTHLIFTSKTTVILFMDFIAYYKKTVEDLRDKIIISVGQATANSLNNYGIQSNYTAKREQAEGIIEILESLSLKNAHIFWPHSNKARSLLKDYLKEKKVKYSEAIFYDTVFHHPKIPFSFDDIDSIFFTSPSTVDGFLAIFKKIPYNKKMICIGSVTQNHLDRMCTNKNNMEQINV